MAIRVNIAIGDVKGTNEHIFISKVSTVPAENEYTTTMKAITNNIVIGITEVLMSSSFEAVEPIAP